jgi:hypothetical protein
VKRSLAPCYPLDEETGLSVDKYAHGSRAWLCVTDLE